MSTKALETAKAKGRAAAAAGLAATDNPYMERKKLGGKSTTWASAFRRAWFDGFDEVKNERLKRPVCRRR